MTEVLFYETGAGGARKLLPQMLESCLERGWRALVQTGSADESQSWNQWLWTYDQNSFLPHGLADEDNAKEQPICITHTQDAPNQPQVVFVLDAGIPDASIYKDGEKLERQVYILEGEAGARAASEAWQHHAEAGHAPVWWHRVQGKWQRKETENAQEA